jgi:hypothetical protein
MSTYLENDNDKLFFTYEALNLLNDMDELENTEIYNKNTEILLVPFKLNLNGKLPFNTIMLFNEYNECLNFASMNNVYNVIENKDMLLSSIQCYLYSMFITYKNKNIMQIEFDDFVKKVEFKGFYFFKGKFYIFIDLTRVEINISLVSRDELYWFAMIDEITNKKNVCDIKIHEGVVDFFLQNNEFIFLRDATQKIIEVPSVVYSGKTENKLFFNFIFGNIPCDNNSILGQGYYFTDYNNAIYQICLSLNSNQEIINWKNIKSGIVRYALFLGDSLVKLNYPNDAIDQSEIKATKLHLEERNNNNYEKMTLRISDYDSTWKEQYDTVFLGRIELDDGKLLKNTPIYICKDFYSHIPLSYHYIDTSIIEDVFDESQSYKIK